MITLEDVQQEKELNRLIKGTEKENALVDKANFDRSLFFMTSINKRAEPETSGQDFFES